jgi:hypothetical protein
MAKENVETLCQRAQQAIAQGQNDQAANTGRAKEQHRHGCED